MSLTLSEFVQGICKFNFSKNAGINPNEELQIYQTLC